MVQQFSLLKSHVFSAELVQGPQLADIAVSFGLPDLDLSSR